MGWEEQEGKVEGKQSVAVLRTAGGGEERIRGAHHTRPNAPMPVKQPVHAIRGQYQTARLLHGLDRPAQLRTDRVAVGLRRGEGGSVSGDPAEWASTGAAFLGPAGGRFHTPGQQMGRRRDRGRDAQVDITGGDLEDLRAETGVTRGRMQENEGGRGGWKDRRGRRRLSERRAGWPSRGVGREGKVGRARQRAAAGSGKGRGAGAGDISKRSGGSDGADEVGGRAGGRLSGCPSGEGGRERQDGPCQRSRA